MQETSSVKPLFYIILLNLVGAALISILYGQINSQAVILTGAICAVSIISYIVVTLADMGDAYLYLIISVLGSVGCIMQLRIKPQYGTRQLKWFLVGTACYFAAMFLYRLFNKRLRFWSPLYFGVSVALFVATMIFGRTSHGSQNWIIIGKLSVQPSELIRILFIMTIASIFTVQIPKHWLDKLPVKIKPRMLRLFAASFVTAINAGFLLLQREWGLTLLFLAAYLAFIYVYGASRIYLAINAVGTALVGYFGATHMSHIKVRFDTWLHPFADASGKGYQITQSLFAIGEGGFAGRGIGEGSVYFIPEVHSDFIFSAICEEMGVLGGMAIIMLYFVLVYRGFKITLSCTNKFNKAVAFGLSVILGLQTFIIIGGVTKMIPLTGITLPFISYGGSSMLTTFAACGILQAISGIKEEISDEIQ